MNLGQLMKANFIIEEIADRDLQYREVLQNKLYIKTIQPLINQESVARVMFREEVHFKGWPIIQIVDFKEDIRIILGIMVMIGDIKRNGGGFQNILINIENII